MPPEAPSVSEYAVPTIPLVRAPVAVLIAGLTGTVRFIVPLALLFATEVAVTVTVSGPLTVAGAVYVAAVVVVFDSAPHADPVQPLPDKAHVTPAALVSLVTVADNLTESPGSMFAAEGCAILTVGVKPPPVVPLFSAFPPHPVSPVNPATVVSMKIPEICATRRRNREITGEPPQATKQVEKLDVVAS